MKPTSGVWGIDLGQCALKAMRLQEIDGQLQATAIDYIEYPKILSQPDADPDQLTREALEQFLSRNSIKGDTVAIAVPGQSGLARFVKLPPVEEKKIADIVKFEAKQQIPFNLDEVVWDYQKLGSGNVVDDIALETEIGLFAMKRDMVNKYLQHFKEVGVEVHLIQMAPLSLCNFVAYDLLNKDPSSPPPEGKQPAVVALDLGTDSSNLVVTDGGKIIWQRPIPLGGNHFTRALTKDLKLTFAKAEHLKRNATKSGAAELKKILASLKPVLNDFVGEVQRSLGYFTNTHRDAQIEYMIGLGNAFRLPGLQRFLGEKLSLDVRKLEKMSRVGGDVVTSSPIFNENILSFGVAYGLCLQGLQQAKLVTNLLPGEIRLERLIRAKKPWAAAAAAALLIGLSGMALGNYLNERPFSAKVVTDAIDKANGAAGRAASMESAFQTAKQNALKEEEAVKSIVAGQAERLNWLKLYKFVSDVIPQPDGKNLPPETVPEYFLTRPARIPRAMSGKEAYEEFVRRVRDGFKPLSPKDEKDFVVDSMPPGTDDLVQYSIESIDCRYCDDLPAFWKDATKGREIGDVRPLKHFKEKLPEGKGWVVELSGYTYHRKHGAFIRDTLLTNVARLGVAPDDKPADGAAPAAGTTPPAPAGTPAPAAPAPAPTGDAAPAAGADAAKEPPKDPVKHRVSHVLLYDAFPKPADTTSGFEIIGKGVLDALLGGETGKGGPPGAGPGGMGMTPSGPPAMMMMGGSPEGGSGAAAGAASRSAWRNIGSRAGGGAAGGAATGASAAPGRMGGRGISATVAGAGERSSLPPTSGAGTPTVMPTKAGHTRTEFIILFIWNEPTPSDALRGVEGATTTP
ncbi:MAG: type IV pilus assembly protein PilM [Gemmataceae bacterium]